MLCPEVLSFKEPASYFTTQTVQSNDLTTLKKIHNFHFNHLASVILPDSLKVPKTLTDTLDTDCDYYKISNLNVQDLLDLDFVTCFVNSGQVTLLSIDNRIDCDICLCITPTGRLIINLDKETYQELGIKGKVSHFHSRDGNRYVIDIDLSDGIGSTIYQKNKERLSKLPKKSVIFSWKPPEEDVCPSTVAKYFSEKYQVEVCKLKQETKVVYSVKVPDLDLTDEENVEEVVEWLGMVSLEGDVEVEETYLSSYATPEPNVETGQVRLFQWRGLFNFEKVHSLIKEVEKYVKEYDKQWAAIYVQGFSDCPIAWYHEEHHYYTNGDNGYIILIKNDQTLVCTHECSKKQYK